MTIVVWYKLGGESSPDKVKVEDDACVVNLKHAIKAKWGDCLPWAAPELTVFAAGADPNKDDEPLESYDTIPTDTTGPRPLIVVVPPSQRGVLLAQQEQLRLFKLEFNNVPTGSSGVPHIPEDLEDFPMEKMKPFRPKESNTPLHRFFHVIDDEAEGKVFYSREIQVHVHLENVIKDVIRSCQYHLIMDAETALNGLKVDVGMFRNQNDAICGTIEVKQPQRKNINPPDPDPMVHPKVVTQVLSQMIPLGTMYGVMNVYGILSTYSSWRFFKWAPNGEDVDGSKEASQMLEDLHMSESQDERLIEGNSFVAPQKKLNEVNAKKTRKYPPMSPKPYIETSEADEADEEESVDVDGASLVSRGVLYASQVIPAGPQALQMLAWVLGEMDRSPICQLPAHERGFLYVVQKDALGGYAKLEHKPDYYKGRMPNSKNTRLYVLDELGHRYHGRVYRAMSKNGNLCVLKYFVKSQYALNENGSRVQVSPEDAASKSVQYWNKAYDKWLPSASFGTWGGGEAIIMPDLEKMSLNVDRNIVLQKLEQTMRERFFEKDMWHGDAAWRNVALVRNTAGNILKVCMIDLEPARMIEKGETLKWNDFATMWAEFKQQLEQDWEQFKAAEATAPGAF